MCARKGTGQEADRQLQELLADPGYLRFFTLVVKEVKRRWNMGSECAHQVVLSAIGEPAALASIHAAAMQARDTCTKASLAGLITRRRAIDLLRRDAARPGHRPLPTGCNEIERDTVFRTLATSSHEAPDEQLEHAEASASVRRALASFAQQGPDAARQADLLVRREVAGATYAELAGALECSKNAVRGRVCAAKKAFRKFVAQWFPALRGAGTQWEK